jgi:hypothetical protein
MGHAERAALSGSARWEAAASYETFLQDLHAAGQGPDEPALALALAELDFALEELQVAEEEVRAQREALDDGQVSSHAERQRHQDLFLLARPPTWSPTRSA